MEENKKARFIVTKSPAVVRHLKELGCLCLGNFGEYCTFKNDAAKIKLLYSSEQRKLTYTDKLML